MLEERKTVVVEDGAGGRMELRLTLEDGRYATSIRLNGVLCHLEAMPADRLIEDYKVDDPGYRPQVDEAGHAFLLIPFAH
ncbi:MAG: hypothetical protein EOP06_05945 [Proteobacteria bacterium]|nr:MAG: hypothetical protein EOP06_05945 [Pseudomonadota bacterium]